MSVATVWGVLTFLEVLRQEMGESDASPAREY